MFGDRRSFLRQRNTQLSESHMRALQLRRYRDIVDRFGQLARVSVRQPAICAKLCREVGVTPRTLLRAFRAIHGTTPLRYLRDLRLVEVRRALRSGGEPSVTKVATEFGFHELGRFAGQYREAFGEYP